MKTTTLCELLSMSVVRYSMPVRAWLLSRRIAMLNTERDISRFVIKQEQARQKRIDAVQVRMCADLAMLKRQ